jgi:DNA-binding IclR family transcriptional regulator
VRERGYALVADSPPNICTVAAPVWDAHQVVVGAIGVGGPSTRFGPEQARALAPRLMEIGSAISTHVGSTQPALPHEGSA